MADIWPRDELEFYDTPLVTSVSVGIAGWTKLVGADYDRRTIILCGDGTNKYLFSPYALDTTNFGLPINANQPFIPLTYDDFGPLVMSAWYVTGGSNTVAVAITLAMPRNPVDAGFPGAYRSRKGLAYAPGAGPSLRRNGRRPDPRDAEMLEYLLRKYKP